MGLRVSGGGGAGGDMGAVSAGAGGAGGKMRAPAGTFTLRHLAAAKSRLMEKCRGRLAITPIEPTNVECILDMFLRELGA